MTASDLVAAEEEICCAWNDGEIKSLTHMSGGNEEWLVQFWKNIRPDDWVLASHRCHFHYTLHGGKNLLDKVKNGKSMFLYAKRFLCSAIVAGTASIAAGLALSIKLRGRNEKVWCFIGDGAEDEGNFYEAVRLVHARELPCTFVIEDNDSSCGASHEMRGSPYDWSWPSCVVRHRYVARWPHAGTGIRPKLKE